MESATQRKTLIELFRTHTKPLPTDIPDHPESLPETPGPIQAVLFDVYGTLISSGVGDISLDQTADQSELIRALIEAQGGTLTPTAREHDLAAAFNQIIRADHEAAWERGLPYPEVDIRSIWTSALQDWLADFDPAHWTPQRIATLAINYECAVNPVWPNEGCAAILRTCQAKGLPVGIVSNAQFYTPIMIEALLNDSLPALGIRSDLQVWSYQEKRGKPDTYLYQKIADSLRSQYGIPPEAALFVGNDMLKDVWAATQIGFKSVLFAGDDRSLRLRESEPRCANLQPYATIRSLTHIEALL